MHIKRYDSIAAEHFHLREVPMFKKMGKVMDRYYAKLATKWYGFAIVVAMLLMMLIDKGFTKHPH